MDVQTEPQKALGLICGTFTAWLCLLGFHIVDNAMSVRAEGDIAGALEFGFTVLAPLYLIIGLPIAFIICIPIGCMAWNACEMRLWTKKRHAVFASGLVGAVLGVIFVSSFAANAAISETLIVIAIPTLIGSVSGFVTHRAGYNPKYVI